MDDETALREAAYILRSQPVALAIAMDAVRATVDAGRPIGDADMVLINLAHDIANGTARHGVAATEGSDRPLPGGRCGGSEIRAIADGEWGE